MFAGVDLYYTDLALRIMPRQIHDLFHLHCKLDEMKHDQGGISTFLSRAGAVLCDDWSVLVWGLCIAV